MASLPHAVLCALVATAFWSLLGYALGRHVLPRTLAIGAAPVLGWAVHSAATLPLFSLIGFSSAAVIIVAVLCAVASGFSLVTLPAKDDAVPVPTVPIWAFAAAAILALEPAAAVAPKLAGDAVYVAGPIFDHAKAALIDAMTRQGLPPVNPIFGALGEPGRLAYYYLWHFSAAQVALPLGARGWEADIGLTWFTAFASLLLMMAGAVWLSGRSAAALFVIVLTAVTSLRETLYVIFGNHAVGAVLASPSGFSGWLFQSAWVPQHLMSASCGVAAMLLLAGETQQRSVTRLAVLALVIAAGFESSTFIGGMTFAIAALAAAPFLLLATGRAERVRLVAGLAIAAVIVACLAAPFVLDQLKTVAARGDATPIVVHPFAVLGDAIPHTLRRILDLPAYWLIELPIEFPAIYIAGLISFAVMLRRASPPPEKTALVAFACLGGAGLGVAWLLSSTLGDINDLALRAILPAVMVLTVVAAAGMMQRFARGAIIATALGGFALSLPDTVPTIVQNLTGARVPDGKAFAQSPRLWEAVRRYASPTDRVANNPLYLEDLTFWPVNLSWALLADRSSCFASRELALAYAPLPADRREAISKQFIRVFGGEGTAQDVNDMARTYGCAVVVVVPQDKAWANDPFASSPDYRLAENRNGQWRIYVLRR